MSAKATAMSNVNVYPDKQEVAVIEPRVDKRDHERTNAVVGNIAT